MTSPNLSSDNHNDVTIHGYPPIEESPPPRQYAQMPHVLDTTDAMAWAEEWCRIARTLRSEGREIIDAGWMVGWFANAIGRGQQGNDRYEEGYNDGQRDTAHALMGLTDG